MLNIRHTGIVVGDIDKALYFYVNLLNLKEIKRGKLNSNFVKIFLDIPSTELTYIKLATEGGQALLELYSFDRCFAISDMFLYSHIAFTVKNIDKLYVTLKKNKITCLSTPFLDEQGKNKLFFCRDYDGNLIELVEKIK